MPLDTATPEVDELIDRIGREMITYARDAAIEEVWKIVLDDIVYIPLHQQQVIVWAMRDNLDLPVYPFNRPQFRRGLAAETGQDQLNEAPFTSVGGIANDCDSGAFCDAGWRRY